MLRRAQNRALSLPIQVISRNAHNVHTYKDANISVA
jgi:hypothetical protein